MKIKINDPITIKIRLATRTVEPIFSKEENIAIVFNYVDFCLRDYFEERYSMFDLGSPYPFFSLSDKK